jgi:PAS domain S-box-containing protein
VPLWYVRNPFFIFKAQGTMSAPVESLGESESFAPTQSPLEQEDAAKHLAELAAIVESSDDAIISKDLNGIITSWNKAATRILGYTREEMIGQSILKLIPPNLQSDEPIIIENIRAGRRIEHFETVRLTKRGELIDVSLTISPIKNGAGHIIGASKILRDISSRKRIEASLLQAEKIAATGRMAATIAHEINNPLEAVVNLLYLLRPKITDSEGLSYLDAAESELARVAHIARQTLGFYREHAAATASSFSELAEHAATIYQPRCATAKIKIEKHIEPTTKVVLRKGEIMQVISNIIANSIYAMPRGGILRISAKNTSDPEPGVLLAIADNGSGIPEEDLPHIFEAFFTTRSTIGTGIGLFIAKQFIEGHGGKILVETSTASEIHGTTIRVFLPLHTAYEKEGPLSR